MGCSSEVERVWLTFCVPSGWCVTWYPTFSLCSTPRPSHWSSHRIVERFVAVVAYTSATTATNRRHRPPLWRHWRLNGEN
eukprot:COSAG02_NODE_34752_length_478_cov_8.240106_1_plen_79_part_01